MRKTLFIILGLLLVLGAAGAFAYRTMQPAADQWAVRGIERSVPEAAGDRPRANAPRDGQPEAFRNKGGEGRSGGRGGNWRLVEIALDALNILVGVVGIWLAVMGGRMQRQAMAQTQGRPRSET